MFFAIFGQFTAITYLNVRSVIMAIDRRDIVQMLRRENEWLKARNQKLNARLIDTSKPLAREIAWMKPCARCASLD